MRPPRAALAFTVVIVLSGCLGFGGPPPSDPGAEAVVDDAATAASDVETYRFENDIQIVASDGEETRRITMDNVGAVDRPARKLRTNTSFQRDVYQSFVDGDKAYTKCQEPWGWGVENVSKEGEYDWPSTDPLGRQVELLQSSHVYWVGNETLDGVDVHVIEARPSEETLTKFADRRQFGLLGPGIEDATFTAYIVEESGRIVKSEFDFTVTKGGASADAHMATQFTDYGADVTITIPEEAVTDPHKLGCPGS